MSGTYNAAVGNSHCHKVALLYLITLLRHVGESTRKHPRVKTVERLLLAFAQAKQRQSGICTRYFIFHYFKKNR